jgi:two-component system NtrC family sensor kinase
MRITLKTKIWFMILAIVLIFSFFSLFYFPAQQGKYLLETNQEAVTNLAETIDLGVRMALNEENFEGARDAMKLAKENKRLKFVCLQKEDSVFSSDTAKRMVSYSNLYQYPDSAITDTSKYPKGSILVKSIPFNTKSMKGAILLVFSTDEINRSLRIVKNTSLIVSGAVLLISILIGFWLSRQISVPVLALRDAAQKVGTGDLTQHVINNSGDEIGDLAKAFNKMVEDLLHAREELNTANQNLARTNETLKQTLEDLKAAQEQLVQAEKMASLGQLTAGVAHEINNPINFVTANIQPLKDDMMDILSVISRYEKVIREKKLENDFTELDEYRIEAKIDLTIQEINNLLKGIEEGAIRTSEIVKGLRNFSRMDQSIFKKANINDCLETTLTLLHSTYKNRVEIEKNYGNIPEVDCFPGQINQVFMNILSNAIQAISGEGTIFIKTYQDENTVKISLRDTGSGMTDEVSKKIFDPFFTTKEIGKGTGLGLSISYGIIEKHNGKIEVFSQLGKGTEFVITIPIYQT